jgi:hypothetical protein
MPRRPRIDNVPKTACQKREIKQALDNFKKGRLYNATGGQRITKASQAKAVGYYYAYLNCDGKVRWVNKKNKSQSKRKRKPKKRPKKRS